MKQSAHSKHIEIEKITFISPLETWNLQGGGSDSITTTYIAIQTSVTAVNFGCNVYCAIQWNQYTESNWGINELMKLPKPLNYVIICCIFRVSPDWSGQVILIIKEPVRFINL